MRTERAKQQAAKASVRSQEVAEKDWQGNVTRLTQPDPSALSIQNLKALLSVLLSYLAVAPNEESQAYLIKYISRLKFRISEIAELPLTIVRPP